MPSTHEKQPLEFLVREAVDQSTPQRISEQIEVLSQYPFNTLIDGKEVSLSCEILRVYEDKHSSRVFRLITLQGMHQLFAPIIVFDNRGNAEKELTSEMFPIEQLTEAYRKLISGEVAGVMTAIREGAMGPTVNEIPNSSNLKTYTTDEMKYLQDPKQVWDIREEVEMAEMIFFLFSTKNHEYLREYMKIIWRDHKQFAMPLIKLFGGTIERLYGIPADIFSHLSLSEQELSFYDDQTQFHSVDLGVGNQYLEKVISYPYPTEKGTIFITLFRLWDKRNERYSVVRLIQTKPSLSKVDGIRFDSNCTDGVHSLDCHCDCCAQLWVAIDYGLENQQNVIVIEEEDHEGKGYGVVHKGATHLIMRKHNDSVDKKNRPIGNPRAAAAYYGAHGLPHDNRTYRGSRAVIQALNITKVETALMGNGDKLSQLSASGVRIEKVMPVEVKVLTPTAQLGLREKKEGVIQGTYGKVAYAKQ